MIAARRYYGKKRKKFRKTARKKFRGVSLTWDDDFFRNLVGVIGVVLVRRGIRNLLDTYFFPHDFLLSNFWSVVVGVLLIYLLDGTINILGGYGPRRKKLKPSKKTR